MREKSLTPVQKAILAENTDLVEQTSLVERYKAAMEKDAYELGRLTSSQWMPEEMHRQMHLRLHEIDTALNSYGYFGFFVRPQGMITDIHLARVDRETGNREPFTNDQIGFLGKLTLTPYAIENYLDEDVSLAMERLEVQTQAGIVIQ